jgi:tRNA threonylcarbamoyladenosine biosynthesis protein TsaB
MSVLYGEDRGAGRRTAAHSAIRQFGDLPHDTTRSVVHNDMESRLLILETSHRVGHVALALGDAIVGERALDESRRHARDLTPAIHQLLDAQGWHARELDGVIVSRGPGSYTGLRVGIMAAKTLSFASGCRLLAIDTFDAIAAQAPRVCTNVDVIADAQQDNVYAQRFGTHPEPLVVLPLDMWLESARAWNVGVTGPGLEKFADRLAGLKLLPPALWNATPASLLKLGLARFRRGERDDGLAAEPLYLRASEAERKWDARQK